MVEKFSSAIHTHLIYILLSWIFGWWPTFSSQQRQCHMWDCVLTMACECLLPIHIFKILNNFFFLSTIQKIINRILLLKQVQIDFINKALYFLSVLSSSCARESWLSRRLTLRLTKQICISLLLLIINVLSLSASSPVTFIFLLIMVAIWSPHDMAPW